MTNFTFFTSVCSHCHRKNQFRLQRLGRLSKCSHCQKQFVAESMDCRSAAEDDPMNYWTRFTDHDSIEGLADLPHSSKENSKRTPR